MKQSRGPIVYLVASSAGVLLLLRAILFRGHISILEELILGNFFFPVFLLIPVLGAIGIKITMSRHLPKWEEVIYLVLFGVCTVGVIAFMIMLGGSDFF